jgi:4-amino-4-deoxy-L-arabinose transferase-like glycosyltransferase
LRRCLRLWQLADLMVRVLRAAWPALLAIVLALSPFLDKAFTIDDTLFLRVAEHALVEPLAPMAFTYTWSDHSERMSELLANGPLGGYLLVPTVLAGGAEWVAHLTWWVLFALAVLATVSLALRIGLPALYAAFAGVLVATAPAVLALASTNMPDVPAMALATLGMERLFAWRKEQRWHQAAVAAVALALAPLARSQTLLLWPLAALVPFLDAVEPRDWKAFVPWKLAPVVALPVILWAATRLTADPLHTGGFVDATRRFVDWDPRKAVVWALQFALTMPLVLWLVLRLRAARWWWALVFAAATAWAAWHLAQLGPRRFVLAPVAALTATVLVGMAADAWRRRDLTRVILVGWTLISLPVVFYVHTSAKYYVPSAPAIALLVALAAREVSGLWARAVLGVGAAAGLVFGVLIVEADARYADLGRRAAAELIAPRVAQGQQVWFAGHWGFQWYAERAGGRIVTRTPPEPLPGDALVASTLGHGSLQVRLVPGRRLVTSLADERPGGRLMSSGAGFWSIAWGYLPWAWGDDVLERFEVWQIPAAREEMAPPIQK